MRPPLSQRLDEYQRSHRWASFPVAVAYKFVDDQGPYLAALITYYGFLSLFPLLLLLASVLGFVLQRDPELQRQILDSALSQFPVIGDQLGEPQGLRGSVGALVVGGLVALYGALGVAQALQNAMNVAWSIPRRHRPNAIRARLRSSLLIVLGGVAVLATTVLSALGSSAGQFGTDLGRLGSSLFVTGSICLNAAVFVAAFRICTHPSVALRAVVPGALVATAIWQLLQFFGTSYVANIVKGADATYGVFSFVLGLFAWLFLAATGIVIGAEINVVRTNHLYPRALMTLFTDEVDLTDADRRAYTDAARAQQFKGFQSVDVTYADDGLHASGRRRDANRDAPAAPRTRRKRRPRA